MASRDELYRRFAERFHAGKSIRPATEAQLNTAEEALGVLWPDSYRRFALACGALYTPSLLGLVVDRKSGYSDVQQFLTPRQSVTETRRAGLEPAGACLVLATDCSGNCFAFRELPASPPRLDDAPVWLLDHEEDSVSVEAASFDEWLSRFLSL
jgi:hypothetical protein